MKPLFSSRVGILAAGGGQHCRVNWPLGKVLLDGGYLILTSPVKEYRLRFADIDCIESRFLSVQVRHRAFEVPEFVTIFGFRLFHRLRLAVEDNNLGVRMSH